MNTALLAQSDLPTPDLSQSYCGANLTVHLQRENQVRLSSDDFT